jgi:hypothetical protein
MRVTVHYSAGPYSGTRTVHIEEHECNEDAIAKVRSQIRREMTLPMYSESYRVESVEEGEDE